MPSRKPALPPISTQISLNTAFIKSGIGAIKNHSRIDEFSKFLGENIYCRNYGLAFIAVQ
jgi:hypothetical protein